MANTDDKYIAIQQWMVTQLELTGNELIIYGYIYSYQFKNFWKKETPDKVTPTEIPLRDFMDWTRSNKKNTILAIQRLQSKGYISVITNAGHINRYSVNPEVVMKATGGVSSDTSVKKTPVSKQHLSGVSSDTGSGVITTPQWCHNDTGVVSPATPHSIRNTKNTQTILEYKKSTHACEEADASSLSTDTETEPKKEYGDYSKTEIAYFEKQALNRLNETDDETDQKKYLTSNPQEQFPEAFLFMTAKQSPQFTDMEFELYKMVMMYTAFSKTKKERIIMREEAEQVPPVSEIGQEAHDAQQKFVDWAFHDGASPIQMARRK